MKTLKKAIRTKAKTTTTRAAKSRYTSWLRALNDGIEQQLKNTEATPLKDYETAIGSGLYVIYYTGQHKPVAAYEPIARRNRRGKFAEPIYVGVAKPSGHSHQLRGINPLAGHSIQNSLRTHAKSILAVNEHMTLDINDFYFKAIPIDLLNAEVAKMVLIDKYAPIWNTVVKGFANHNVGSTRLGQRRSRWDILHMGRAWGAMQVWNEEGTEEILQDLTQHYGARKQIGRQVTKENRIAAA